MTDHRLNSAATLRLSRRTTLAASAFGLAAVAGLKGTSAAAQQDDLPEMIAAYVAGWEALDADQIAEQFAEDGVREEIATGVVTQGREEIRRALAALFDAFSELSIELPTAFATQDHAAATWQLTGTYTGQVPGFPPGTGQPVTAQGVTILELADDQIQRAREYYDTYGVLVQLGVLPPPESEAEDAATPAATPVA